MTKTSNQKTGKTRNVKKIREEYYPKLKSLIESIGEWNINYLQLQKEWDIPDSTLLRWRDQIFTEVGPIDITKIGREVCKGTEYNVKMLQKMAMRAEKSSSKIAAIKAMNDTIRTFTEMLESYKFKAKVSEKFDLSGDLPIKIVINKDVKDNPDKK